MRNFKNLILCLLILSLGFIQACSSDKTGEKSKVSTSDKIVTSAGSDADRIKVSFDIQNYGTFTVETYPEQAPESVARFLELVESGYYDGMNFETLSPGKSLVASSKTALSSGELMDTINGEFSANGYSNDVPLERGTLAFCYLPDEYDTATAKFMILLSSDEKYNGKLAGFAKVVEGTEIFDSISRAPINADYTPVSPIVMKKVYIKK